MVRVKPLQDALLRALSTELAPMGFSAATKQQAFVRPIEGFVWTVHVGFVRHRDDVDATIDLGVLLTAVDELFDDSCRASLGSATIGAEMGNLVDRRPRRWTIASEEDAQVVGSEMRSEIQKFGVAWLQRFSSLETVFEVLRANNLESRLIMPLQLKRCAMTVALAGLLLPKQEAEQVASECRSFLSNRAEPMLHVFDDCAAHFLAY